jgi:hypothetical protein
MDRPARVVAGEEQDMTNAELDTLWSRAEQFSGGFTRYRFAALVAAAERTRACRIVTGLCISDNNAREINEAIRTQAADRLARHGIQIPEDEEYGNPSF